MTVSDQMPKRETSESLDVSVVANDESTHEDEVRETGGLSVSDDPRPMTEDMNEDQRQEVNSPESPTETLDDSAFDFEQVERASPSQIIEESNGDSDESSDRRYAEQLSEEIISDEDDDINHLFEQDDKSEVGEDDFQFGDKARERHRLQELKLVEDGVKRIEESIDEAAQKARHERLAMDRADNGQIIIRLGSATGYTVAEATAQYEATKAARMKEEKRDAKSWLGGEDASAKEGNADLNLEANPKSSDAPGGVSEISGTGPSPESGRMAPPH